MRPAATAVPFGDLTYGAANVGNLFRALTDDEAHAVLDAAWEAGIRSFDTAPHYGLGLSERRLGAFLRSKPRDEFVLSTKVGRLLRPNPAGAGDLDLENDFHVPADLRREWDLTSDGVRRSVEESLERLGLDRIDVLYLHDPERHSLRQGLDVAIPALAALRDEGVVTAVGVGSMTTEALVASAETGAVDLLMVAGRYTLAEQPAAIDVFPACERNGVGVVVASVFNSGLLAQDVPSREGRYEYGSVPDDVFERVSAIAAAAADVGVPLPQAALHYVSRHPLVRTVVIGASRPEQIRQNAERMAAPVPEELWDRLAAEGLVVS
ncbi:aldo/keto reductase [Labedella endophytica]|uniref:Aldo/keto reductase n=1 Tax=Labedella endophytica TaxID=1523160 RepID=A0A3S1CTC9_9MICO|nr:aldo/keto reductase [Labedella endophytica]